MAKNTRRANGNADPLWNEQRQRYALFLELPRSEDGKRRRKKVSGKTKTEARQHAREVRQSVDATGEATDDSITVAVMMRGFLDGIPGTVSEGTLQIYRRADRLYITPALRRRRSLISSRGTGPYQLDHGGERSQALPRHTAPGARRAPFALRWAQNEGMTTRNNRRDRAGPPGRVRGRAATRAGTGRDLLAASSGYRHEAAIVLMLATGLRSGETFGLTFARSAPRRRSADAQVRQHLRRSRRCRPGARRTQNPRLAAVARAAPHGGQHAPSSMGRTERGTSPARCREGRTRSPSCPPRRWGHPSTRRTSLASCATSAPTPVWRASTRTGSVSTPPWRS